MIEVAIGLGRGGGRVWMRDVVKCVEVSERAWETSCSDAPDACKRDAIKLGPPTSEPHSRARLARIVLSFQPKLDVY